MKEQEGPTKQVIPERVIPEHTIIQCFPCKYYKHRLVRSGIDPIYRSSCTHPNFAGEYSVMRGVEGREINDASETPEWCPYLKDETKEK